MDHVEVFKALSNKSRLQILDWLKDPATNFPDQLNPDFENVGVCVGQIQIKAGLSQSTISEYLSILQRANLVCATRVGQWTYYKRNAAGLQMLSEIINTEI
ncbi:ArsR/SmtB family transcription factor [Pedobacter sandarakinus]|uniref:ArsR/SmtB family transcription factor n=1 Tax=Pedobacter sandarakinus TaxID=353156 RepID=UPI002247E90B|nr:helix-turn-helix transcriptional regulator [Pedobacter sandarakinus]MCX2573387.1 helix-turn-helix transcriptional regulator [Pedobacter sandarakinus]